MTESMVKNDMHKVGLINEWESIINVNAVSAPAAAKSNNPENEKFFVVASAAASKPRIAL